MEEADVMVDDMKRELAEAKARIRELEAFLGADVSASSQDCVLASMGLIPFCSSANDPYSLSYVGESVFAITGFSAQRFYADRDLFLSRIHKEDRPDMVRQIRQLSEDTPVSCYFRWRVSSGDWRWFTMKMRYAPACGDAECDALRVVGLCQDVTGRHLKEEALVERANRYRTVADFAHDWEFWMGPDGKLLYVSPSCERVTGYLSEEIQHDPSLFFDTVVHPSDREWVHGKITESLASAEPVSFDFRIITRQGDVRWLGHVSQAVFDDDGVAVGRRISNRDITELKETVQSLREKNQFIGSIMDNSTAMIYAKDVDGRYLFGNNRFMNHLNRPVHEVLAHTDYDLFDHDLADRYRASDLIVSGSAEPHFEEFEIKTASGAEFWTTSKFPLLSGDGQVLGVCGISLDVTEWREAERGMRRMSRAVEQSPVSIVMTDVDGVIRSVNPHCCAVSGYSEEEMLGQEFDFMLSEESVGQFAEVWATVRQGGDWHGEMCSLKKTGEVLWESLSVSPVRGGQGRIINYVAVKEDITERKRLERLEKDVELIVRHDLKSPMMSFIWVPRTLRKADNITEEQAVMLHELEKSGHRLLKMVNLSLDLFKMEEGSYEFTPEDLNVLRVIHNVRRDLTKVTSARKVRVAIKCEGREFVEGDCLLVRGEELLFHSMLANLMKNAVEASETGDVVTIDCWAKNGVQVRVHNAGEVPECVRDSFFEKYSTSGKKFGTGLGTYSARLMAETQGGTVAMRTSEANGTEVVISFPDIGSCEITR